MNHANCGGSFAHWIIREHHFDFFRCEKCGHYLGGEATKELVVKLMRIKVFPTVRRDR